MIYLLTFSLLTLTIITLIVAIRARFRTWIMLLLIPFLIFNIGFSYHTIKELWGYPVAAFPEGEVELLAYKIEQPNIFIVVRESDGRVRFHQIPYNKRTEEQLDGAGKSMKKGQRMMMKKQGREHDQESKVEFYNWRPSDSMPKEMK